MESYLNGNEDDFDVIKDHGLIVDGSWAAWTQLCQQTRSGLSNNTNYQKVQGKHPDGTINSEYENLLDVENLIGYMQYNMYIGNEDWDHNNWLAARNRVTNDAGFHFFCWDAETSMVNVNYNNVDENNEGNPSWFYHELQENEDFRILFADHIQKNFFNGGPLTPESVTERYNALADEIDLAIIAESARWGDYRKDVSPSDGDRLLYTRNGHWLARKENLLINYFPYRTDIVVQQFRSIGLFPQIKAPEFSHYGGEIYDTINLQMTTNYGEIYFTTDGSDPRKPITSEISDRAQLYKDALLLSSTVTVKARAKSGGEWSPITVANFDFTTTVEEGYGRKTEISAGCFPNPFNESTDIFYTLPKSSLVEINVFSMDGKKIGNVFSGFQLLGTHTVNWRPANDASGIFIYQIRISDQVFLGKIIRNKL